MFGYNFPENKRSEETNMENNKRYVLKNKKRFFSVIFIILAIMFIAVFSDISYGYDEPTYKTLIVKPGDTLWDIAAQHKNSCDIREFVYKIKKLNGLKTSSLIVGKEIKIPIH